ncbi:MAG: hypothetical protein ABIA47_01000 [bacterium]
MFRSCTTTLHAPFMWAPPYEWMCLQLGHEPSINETIQHTRCRKHRIPGSYTLASTLTFVGRKVRQNENACKKQRSQKRGGQRVPYSAGTQGAVNQGTTTIVRHRRKTMTPKQLEEAQLRQRARLQGVKNNDRLSVEELKLVFHAKDLGILGWNKLDPKEAKALIQTREANHAERVAK